VTADFDRNRDLDLAVANYMSASVFVLLGNGDGTFAPKLEALDGPFPVAIGAADCNGDLRHDMAIGSEAPSLAVVLGNGGLRSAGRSGWDRSYGRATASVAPAAQ